jgi:hypothetical protein
MTSRSSNLSDYPPLTELEKALNGLKELNRWQAKLLADADGELTRLKSIAGTGEDCGNQ